MRDEQRFMEMALRLARKGLGRVEPNPAVGCVIVREGRIIGRGYHHRFGGPHAEIEALRDCAAQGHDPAGATMFVTLEPCCHTGKTGPCTEAIIAAGIGRVVAAVGDPAKHVAGKGFARLRKAGIAVEVGLCGREAALLNAPFIHFARTGRPWVILKWAQSRDGFLARKKTDKSKWISNTQSRRDVHRLRRRCQAILVGVKTIIQDNPLLTPRPAMGKRPLRVVVDSRLRIPPYSRVLDAREYPTLVVTTKQGLRNREDVAQTICARGARMGTVPLRQGACDLGVLLTELGKLGVQQLLVEGGPKVLNSFVKNKLADAVCVYIAPKKLGVGGTAPLSKTVQVLTNPNRLYEAEVVRFGHDQCVKGLIRPITV
ncbi:MAG: bifunctional diaminohydroxyphosphoribosylaminopyrimidine deaminase/5-amino-6-(5-phosphoribosylamino)uracil reductase RibD [Phycisphaerae bacterium]|nr:bifunctional diaminohydroxyphosphoribosylaminopyrimidine deaminase/5-amino-6-(5-phosphoribosylamino)uracil reductase RibD [Phycisphaerae bacterium]